MQVGRQHAEKDVRKALPLVDGSRQDTHILMVGICGQSTHHSICCEHRPSIYECIRLSIEHVIHPEKVKNRAFINI